MFLTLWLAAVTAQALPSDEAALAQLPAFLRDQTTLERAFDVAKLCEKAYDLAEKDKVPPAPYGKALASVATAAGLSALNARALERDCMVWFLGNTAGRLDAAAEAAVSREIR